MIQMGDQYQDKWFDYLPWILLMKRVTYQKELNASPSMLALGSNVAIPGNLLRDPGEPLSLDNPELEELVKLLSKNDQKQPIPTGKPKVHLVAYEMRYKLFFGHLS